MVANKGAVRRALDLCDAALYPYVGAREKVDAAWEALRLSLDCCTAYTLLAWHHAGYEAEVLRLHHQAVEAGERALEKIRLKRRSTRKRLFRRPGEFPEAVAYARSRLALAAALHEAGRLDDAIEHSRAVFEANEDESTDPLGASHLYIRFLLEKEMVDEDTLEWEWDLPDSMGISDNLEWVGRSEFQVFSAWGGKTDYEIDFWRAQDIIWDLAENPYADEPSIQEAYARAALKVCRDCADAYVILGGLYEECNEDLVSARQCYENGVQAGECALKKLRGPEVFDTERGYLYGVLEGRPYVRARGKLALTLYGLGEKEAAETHARALLELNRHDNLGIRYQLARWLHEQGRIGELEKHLRKHHAFGDDPSEYGAGFGYEAAHVLPDSYANGDR